jgi:hypothetical protein
MPAPFELWPILKSRPSMESHPVVEKEDIARFLPETDTQIISFCRFFQKVQSLALLFA